MSAVAQRPLRFVAAGVGLLAVAATFFFIGLLAKWAVGDVLAGITWLVGIYLFVTALTHGAATKPAPGLRLVAWGVTLFLGSVGVMMIVGACLHSWHQGLLASTFVSALGAGLMIAGIVWYHRPHSN